MTSLLVIGATSAIAQATARLFAADGARIFLVGRDAEKLEAVAGDLRVCGAKDVQSYVLDMNDLEKHAAMVAAATTALGELDAVLIAHGTLGDQRTSETLVVEALREWSTNATSVIAALTLLANECERQRHGTIAVISSVAGDRGRRSNYVYGAAKAALNVFLEGLRARMARAGVVVVTVKPGFVDTPMTSEVPKNFLFAPPERVARDIYHAMAHGTGVVYSPRFWRPIMLLLRLIPEPIFRKLPI